MTRKHSLMTAGILVTALAAASPFAFAHDRDHKGDHHRGKHNIEQMCEQFRDGDGPFNREDRMAEMQERRAEMADRLKLTDEQRQIWDEMHQEKIEKHQERMEKFQEKMQERCDDADKRQDKSEEK
ncbi:hypothetical protein FWJ25_03545 [Marinobacter salinexigens]|uniref:Zinc resistance-associated protein n=1 Tax=Marinobacter salinexigens TaxID=2919747 RepID=A0A5B0VPV4_9GAMM|nr:hypothetical protein FWJ25_03545 [Marinobacter salinexigens]